MLTGTFDTLQNAWISSVERVYAYGVLRDTEYSKKARMVNGMLLEIQRPDQHWHPKDPFCSPMRVKLYVEQFKRDSIGKHGFEYTYIDRLVNYKGFDQLKWIREQLQAGRHDTKRLQAISWMPLVDCNKPEDQPCFQRIWIYPYSDKTFDAHIHYRSWDLFKAFEANLIAFQELIQDEFCKPCGFELKTLRCFADNVHIYEDDFQDVERVLIN